MGKMPAGLARYWRNKRAGRRSRTGTIMARRRFGRRGGRRYGRRAAHAVRRGGSKMMRMVGITKGGLKVSRALAFGSAIMAPFVPAYGGKSAVQILMEPQGGALSTKIAGAGAACAWTGLGINAFPAVYGAGATNTVPATKGICGMGVLAGVGIGIAGKFVNGFLAGSPVKL